MVDIENAAALSDLFGHWPSFHDAELTVLRLDATGEDGPSLDTEFEVAEMSDELDARGYYRDLQRAQTTLRFEEVAALQLSGFLYQNVLFDLSIAVAGPDEHDEVFGDNPLGRRRYRVRWTSSIGCEATFLCNRIRVVEVTPVERAT